MMTTMMTTMMMTMMTTVTVTVENLADVTSTRKRLFFTPDRSNPEPSLVEDRVRNRHAAVSLAVRHSF